MKGYTTREVAEVVGLPTSTILTWAHSGLLSPRRGPRGAYVFSFQDVALLRGARMLLESEVPTRRVREALERLREQLPAGRPLSAVLVSAEGGRVVARDDDRVWDPGTGQMHMDFSGSPGKGEGPIEPRRFVSPEVGEPTSADEWYDHGVDLEAAEPDGARSAYERALVLDPEHPEAHLNLGRLVHEAGDLAAAEYHYRRTLMVDPENARAFYNLGVALEDQGHRAGATDAYEAALRLDPDLAAAHFNLSMLYEKVGREADALAHLVAYKRVLRGGGATP